MPKPLDPNGLEGAFAPRRQPTSLDFLIPAKEGEGEAQAPKTAPTVTKTTARTAKKKKTAKKKTAKKKTAKKKTAKKKTAKKKTAKKKTAKKKTARTAKKTTRRTQKVEAPQAEAPKAEAPKAPKAEAPKVEAPTLEAPQVEIEAPKPALGQRSWRPRLVDPWSPSAPTWEAPQGVRGWIGQRIEGVVRRIIARAA